MISIPAPASPIFWRHSAPQPVRRQKLGGAETSRPALPAAELSAAKRRREVAGRPRATSAFPPARASRAPATTSRSRRPPFASDLPAALSPLPPDGVVGVGGGIGKKGETGGGGVVFDLLGDQKLKWHQPAGSIPIAIFSLRRRNLNIQTALRLGSDAL